MPEDNRSVAKEGVNCKVCDAVGFRNNWFLRRHMEQMHSQAIKCEICKVEFVDKFSYRKHASGCFFWCPNVGCPFHEKRLARVLSHQKKCDKGKGPK